MSQSVVLSLTDPSGVGAARRQAARLCATIGFTSVRTGNVEIAVNEAGNNLIKHAGQGQILMRSFELEGIAGLEILALDKGPGMVDVSQCLSDGYSSAGSTGTGLGAIKRLSNVFDIYSQPRIGTALVAQFWAKPPPESDALQVGAVCVPLSPAEPSGDDWSVFAQSGSHLILVVDGLGHGFFAASAAEAAVKAFHNLSSGSPVEIIHGLHGVLRTTRGASLAVAQLDLNRGMINYAGVGNIAGVVQSGDLRRSMVSQNGTVGHELHRVQQFNYPWSPNSILVMHSDGLLNRWSIDRYPGLLARHASLIAGVLFRDFQRGRDDVAVLVARQAKNMRNAAGQ